MINSRKAFVLGLALTLASAVVSFGQAKPPAVFSVGLDAVNVTLTVRDPVGRFITNLHAEDFDLYEDGKKQSIRVFARAMDPGQDEALALDLGMLMDTSESMLKELKLSKEAAVRFLDSIPRARDLLTIFFDQEIQISRYDSENQQGLIRRIHETKGGGNTALYDAIAAYLSRAGDTGGRKIMVLFSDGEDTLSSISAPELNQALRSSSATIFCIAFQQGVQSSTRTRAKAFLLGLADMTGGQVFWPSSSKDLPGIYEKILDELKAQYVLGFISDNATRDGRYRKLKVEVKAKNLKVRHREGYLTPKG
jgi:Ca-activated chloride channel family protein